MMQDLPNQVRGKDDERGQTAQNKPSARHQSPDTKQGSHTYRRRSPSIVTRKIATMAVVGAAMVLALSIGRANAKSDKESCQSTTMDETNTNADGTQCESEVGGSGPNKAIAISSGKSSTFAQAEDGADFHREGQQRKFSNFRGVFRHRQRDRVRRGC
jgi:hypothetical protein